LTGGGVGDVMLRVPVDRELALRNKEAVIGNGYFRETVAVAVHEDLTGPAPSFDTFRNMRIGVQIGTVADYFLMRYANGALIANIDHHLRPEQGAERFAKRQIAALMGLRSHLEPMLAERGAAAKWVEIPAPGLVRAEWVLGTAVKENSRDLHYAIAAALSDMRSSGELAGIFARFGVTYVPPRDPS
jgi:ABC-type amino acid transport substrate-binding protein